MTYFLWLFDLIEITPTPNAHTWVVFRAVDIQLTDAQYLYILNRRRN